MSPGSLSNFESVARSKRYQALGAACIEHGFPALLLGHHQDDVAESCLMRLASGKRQTAFHVMGDAARMPENWAVHGVGSTSLIETTKEASLDHDDLQFIDTEVALARTDPVFEFPGMTIMRPLIKSKKMDLVQLCTEASVSWIEDLSNKELSLTPRNVVRHLLLSRRLPLALSTKSLLSVVRTIQSQQLWKNSITSRIFRDCKIHCLDVRSGGLLVTLPTKAILMLGLPALYEPRNPFHGLIRRLARVVTPLLNANLTTLQAHIWRIFFPKESSSIETVFTLDCVSIRVIHSRISHLKLDSDKRAAKVDADYTTLHLSRQPPNSRDLATIFRALPPSSNWSPFHLLDGRYWLRVFNKTSQLLKVRFLQPRDLAKLRLRLCGAGIEGAKRWEKVHRLINDIAPEKQRWSLLVITTASSAERNDPEDVDQEDVIAFPSLGQDEGWVGADALMTDSQDSNETTYTLQDDLESKAKGSTDVKERPVQWEIRFKDIEPCWLEREVVEGFVRSWASPEHRSMPRNIEVNESEIKEGSETGNSSKIQSLRDFRRRERGESRSPSKIQSLRDYRREERKKIERPKSVKYEKDLLFLLDEKE